MSKSSEKRFKKSAQPTPSQDYDITLQQTPSQYLHPNIPYQKGDFISQKYEVIRILGKGGFGIVYLVKSLELGGVIALKTFLDEYLIDREVRKRFHMEASVWVELGNHPNLVRAFFVDEFSGRLYIAMEYIAPNEEELNSLEGYLQQRPSDLVQSLHWAIQICHGMEYAYAKGVRAHRDLKPANIMISQDKIAKVSDFGLAGVFSESSVRRSSGLDSHMGLTNNSGQTMLGRGFGTPTHMPPEQFSNAAGCDERSDIYSFGIVLYQMATSNRLPFLALLPRDNSEAEGMRFWKAMERLHLETSVPHVDSPLFPIIENCLEKSPNNRFQTFQSVRKALELLLKHQTGEKIIPSQLKGLDSWEWDNKGTSLDSLGRFEEAIHCFDNALATNPKFAAAWSNKGNSLGNMGLHKEAILCHNKALELDPHLPGALNNKGNSLNSLGQYEEAIRFLDTALKLDPKYAIAWNNKGNSLNGLSRFEESIFCFDEALKFNPHLAAAWNNKAGSFCSLNHIEEAILCFEKALEIDPNNVVFWYNKGIKLISLRNFEGAISCFDHILELDPKHLAVSLDKFKELAATAWIGKASAEEEHGQLREAEHSYKQFMEFAPAIMEAAKIIVRAHLQELNKLKNKSALSNNNQNGEKVDPLQVKHTEAKEWVDKGFNLEKLNKNEEAIHCYDQALKIDPRYAIAWNNKGVSLDRLSRYNEALFCYSKALEYDPNYVTAWNNKGICLGYLNHNEEAILCYDKVLKLDPDNLIVLYNMAYSEDIIGQYKEAACFYQQFLKFDLSQYPKKFEHARNRLREIEGK